MKKILICTHGGLAQGFKNALELIVGEVQGVEVLGISMEDTIDHVRSEIETFIEKCDSSDDKIILTDIPGGSTTQAAFYSISSEKRTHVVTGLNLGMLLEIYLSSEEDVPMLLKSCVTSAKETMNYLNDSYVL